jgi:hypothetical protein
MSNPVAGISGRPACGSAFRKVSCGPPPGLVGSYPFKDTGAHKRHSIGKVIKQDDKP